MHLYVSLNCTSCDLCSEFRCRIHDSIQEFPQITQRKSNKVITKHFVASPLHDWKHCHQQAATLKLLQCSHRSAILRILARLRLPLIIFLLIKGLPPFSLETWTELNLSEVQFMMASKNFHKLPSKKVTR